MGAVATCDGCFDLRHCFGRNGCSCTVCEERGSRVGRKRVVSKGRRPCGPRPVRGWEPDADRKQVVPVVGVMRDVVVESLVEGMSIMWVANRTNFTPAQIRAVARASGVVSCVE